MTQANSVADSKVSIDLVPIAGSWLWPLSRGIVALGIGLAITFTSHLNSIELALGFFIAFTALSGILELVFVKSYPAGTIRNVLTSQAIITLAAALVGAAIWLQLFGSASISYFLILLIIWAAVTGVLELYLGITRKGKFADARDWQLAGGFTALLALITLFIDPKYEHAYTVTAKDAPDYHGVITASISSLGYFGAYAVILGVFILIGAFSLRKSKSQ